MDKIIPRWEWRTFGDSFGAADAAFAALTAKDITESDEIYFLAPATNENVKVRDKLMDIETLQQVNADGLEQWMPVMKGTFPLPVRGEQSLRRIRHRRACTDAHRLHA